MTEFGSLALVDEGAGDGDRVHISLPGVRRGRSRFNPSLVSLNCSSSCLEPHILVASCFAL